MSNTIYVKTKADIAKLRKAGQISADTLTYLSAFVKPGLTTSELDNVARSYIESRGCTPSFLGYRNYPKSICTSINDEAVHCIPGERVLKEGDIITLDLGAKYEDFYGDTAKTFAVGTISQEATNFIQVGYDALLEGIKKCRHGNHVQDISNTVFDYVSSKGHGVIKDFTGHGIGKTLHEHPQIFSVKLVNKGPQLVAGMVVCLEPIITIDPKVTIKSNGPWNVVANSLVVHHEHMVLITEDEPEVLTKRKEENF